MHRHFEELCGLAATGRIDPGDQADLEKHLESCGKCRAFLDDVAEVGPQAGVFTSAVRRGALEVQAPIGIRERFLERALAQGFRLTAELMSAPTVVSDTRESDTDVGFPRQFVGKESAGAWKTWPRLRPIQPLNAALAVMACAVFGVLGYLLALERHPVQAIVPVVTVSNDPKADSTDIGTLAIDQEQEKARLEQKILMISAQLAAAEAGKQELAKNLADLAQRAAASAQFEQQFGQKTRELQDAEELVAKLKSELELAQHKQTETDATLVAQQQATEDAQTKLATAQLQLQKQQELVSARSEIGDLISARNLHIVDVRDSEPGGKRQRAFGRVFYVEGQSLVFYAYDLSTSNHPDKKIIFHVWGETASVKETTHSLGILHSDNPTEARWVLTFDDPKILNRINAVYITAERDSLSKHDPQGRKLLYAFLGSPNHP